MVGGLALHLLFVAFSFVAVEAQLYQSNLVSSCLGQGSPLAPSDQLLDFNQISAQYLVGQQSVGGYAGGVDLGNLGLRDSNGTLLRGGGTLLRVRLTGTTGTNQLGSSPLTAFLATVQVQSSVLTFPVYSNETALCSGIVTSRGGSTTTSGCSYGPGPIALGFDIPLRSSYPFTTINTQLIVLDPSSPPLQLACVNLAFTPYYSNLWGYALIHYVVIGLLALSLFLYLFARVYAARVSTLHEQEARLASSLTVKLSSQSPAAARARFWGTVWYSAWAGRQVISSASLRRFLTAEISSLWHAAVWWTLVGTVAVNWPEFAYPVFSQTAWLALIYKNSLPFITPSPSVLSNNFTLPSSFATQGANSSSPLFLDSTLPNVLLNIQGARKNGMEKWSAVAGVEAKDLWSICAFTFVVMCAIAIVFQLVLYSIDRLVGINLFKLKSASKGQSKRASLGMGEAYSKENVLGRGNSRSPTTLIDGGTDEETRYERMLEQDGLEEAEEEDSPLTKVEDDYPPWLLHSAMLQGNLARLLLIFHLPLSVFAVYQFSLSSSPVSTTALAAIVFAITSVLIPTYLIWRVRQSPFTNRFTSLPLLLSVGPLYNTYSDECTLFAGARFFFNLVLACAIGGGQASGIAQGVIILLVEVADTLVTSLWLPWADPSMGPLAFIFAVTRIIVAVLLIVLTPTVGVSASAASWVTYVVFLMQGLIVVLLLLSTFSKCLELVVRLIGDVPFDESRSPRAGGLTGAWRRWDRGGRSKATGRTQRHKVTTAVRRNPHSRGSSTTDSRTKMSTNGREGLSRSSSSNSSPFDSHRSNHDAQFYRSGFVNSGHVHPGSYSSAPPQGPQPILRKGPVATAPEISTFQPPQTTPPSSIGFSRVAGGKASSSDPYQALGATAYPPYPNNPSTEQFTTRATAPGNPRRLSQSAVIEMASAVEPVSPPRTLPPSDGSNFYSNTLVRRPDDYSRPATSKPKPKPRLGFFGRRKDKHSGDGEEEDTTDESDEDEDEEEEERKRQAKTSKGIWPIRLGRSRDKRASAEVVEEEEEVPPQQKGFVVTRKPRPGPPPSPSTPSSSTFKHNPQLPPPAVSIVPPSPSASLFESPRED